MGFVGTATSAAIGWLKHATAAGSTLLNDLVSYWTLDEVSGTRADSVGANDLTDENTVGVSLAGPSGTVARFVAANTEYLSSTTHPGTGGDYTVSVWARNDNVPNPQLIWVDNNQTYLLVTGGAITFYQQYTGPAQTALAHQTLFVAGAWHHIVCSMVSGKLYLWVNGVAATGNGTDLEGAQTATAAVPWSISFDGLGWDAGEVANVGFWTRSLTANERTSLFNSGAGKRYADLTAAEKVDLVSYWNLDEVSGTRVDAHGANDLTDNNTVGCVNSGPAGTVADLEASNDEYLSAGNLNLSTAFTLSVWFKAEAISGIPIVLGTSDGTTRGTELIYDAGHIYATQHNAATTEFAATYTATIATDAWYHVAATYSNAGDKLVHLYVNGVDQAQSAEVTGTPGVEGPIRLGIWAYGKHDGLLANAGMWSRALTAQEITSLFNLGEGKRYADLTAAEKVDLVSYWDLDEVSGTRADSHGTNDLTDNNTVGSVVNAGGAMDGGAASFVAGNAEHLSFLGTIVPSASDFTVAAWYKDTGIFAAGIVAERVAAGNKGWIISSWDDGKVYAYVGYGTGEKSVSVTSAVNQWHLGVLTYNNSTRLMSFYVDNGTPATDTLEADFVAGDEYFQIAYNNTGIANTCLVDEVAIWNRVLTADERTELWNAGAGKFYDFS